MSCKEAVDFKNLSRKKEETEGEGEGRFCNFCQISGEQERQKKGDTRDGRDKDNRIIGGAETDF